MTNMINLAQLPAPDVVDTLNYQDILEQMLADLRQRAPELTDLLASDPAHKVLEVAAYRELLLRQKINDSARSVMLAYATGSDLDHLAALFGVTRQLIHPGDANAVPPIEPEYEDDERLRERVPLSLEGYSTAGPVGAYVYHSLAASADVKDVAVDSPAPGDVVVSVLSRQADGAASADLLLDVAQHLNHDDVRPLTDHVSVQSASIIYYQVEATLSFYRGPDRRVVAQQSRQKVTEYVNQQHRLGYDITLSGLYAALHQPGVQNVNLVSPSDDIHIEPNQAAFCTQVTVNVGGVDE